MQTKKDGGDDEWKRWQQAERGSGIKIALTSVESGNYKFIQCYVASFYVGRVSRVVRLQDVYRVQSFHTTASHHRHCALLVALTGSLRLVPLEHLGLCLSSQRLILIVRSLIFDIR